VNVAANRDARVTHQFERSAVLAESCVLGAKDLVSQHSRLERRNACPNGSLISVRGFSATPTQEQIFHPHHGSGHHSIGLAPEIGGAGSEEEGFYLGRQTGNRGPEALAIN